MSASPPAPNCHEMTLSRTRPIRREIMVLAARIRAAAPIRCFADSRPISRVFLLIFCRACRIFRVRS